MSGTDEKPVTQAKHSNNLWMTEEQTKNLRLSLKVTDILHQERTPWQDILVVETPEYGRALMLDGAIQLTERDEFCYSEMMAHVPICAHPDPRRVLIVGGGDGAILREVTRKSTPTQMTEIVFEFERVSESRMLCPLAVIK